MTLDQISKDWIDLARIGHGVRLSAGKMFDRAGNPMIVTLKVTVEPYVRAPEAGEA